ncbi:MAG: hypothetical protein ACLR2G_02175 [Phascolarctobacterium faecium]
MFRTLIILRWSTTGMDICSVTRFRRIARDQQAVPDRRHRLPHRRR